MRRRTLLSALGAAFCCGALVTTAVLRVPAPAPTEGTRLEPAPRAEAGPSSGRRHVAAEPAFAAESSSTAGRAATSGPDGPGEDARPRRTPGSVDLEAAEAELRARSLLLPVKGVDPDDLTDTFTAARGRGRHEALDILAPRRTPVRAVEDGRIVKLFTSARGGLTIYQFDPTNRYCYYYGHLDTYADDLAEGRAVERGDVIGYVGTTGNAPPQTPHLHFAVFVLGAERRWWEGTAIDPYPLFVN